MREFICPACGSTNVNVFFHGKGEEKKGITNNNKFVKCFDMGRNNWRTIVKEDYLFCKCNRCANTFLEGLKDGKYPI